MAAKWKSEKQRKAVMANLKKMQAANKKRFGGKKKVGKAAKTRVRGGRRTARAVSRSQVYKIQSARKFRAQAMDNAKNAKKIYKITDPKGRAKWAKAPGRVDIRGIDTRVSGAGKKKRVVRIARNAGVKPKLGKGGRKLRRVKSGRKAGTGKKRARATTGAKRGKVSRKTRVGTRKGSRKISRKVRAK